VNALDKQTRPEFALLALGAARRFMQNEFIYREGEPAAHFLQVVDGVVRSTSVRQDGRRFIDAFHVPGDVFGMEIGPYYARSAEAVCPCSVVLYPSHDRALLQAIKDGLAWQIVESLLHGLRQARDHARLVAQASAIEKTSAFLIEWSSRLEESTVVTLAMTRQDIADHLGLSVETLCRCLAQLNRDGLIEMVSARRFRLLDVPALQKMAA
jgi:CRP/FNR family nitrogen fixation transcriptional regulator